MGIRRCNLVPRPGALVSRSDPPIRLARPRMLSRPCPRLTPLGSKPRPSSVTASSAWGRAGLGRTRQDGRAGLAVPPQRAQRLVQLTVGQDARAQPENVVTQVTNHTVDLRDRGLDALALLLIAVKCRRLQTHADRKERLNDAVVELLGDPLPFVQQADALRLLPGSAVVERHGGLGSERVDELDRGFEEGGSPDFFGYS